MKVWINGRQVEAGRDYARTLEKEMPELSRVALAVRAGGETLSLTEEPRADERVSVVTYADDEGRRVYERSLRFVLLLALRKRYPGARVRLEHSFGNGVYAVVDSVPLDGAAVAEIEAEMRALVARDLPFEKRVITRREAMTLYEREGQADKVRLLRFRPYEHFQMYACEGLNEYFYGVMTPSTRYTPVFALRFYMPGFVMLMPDSENPAAVSPFRDMPKLMRTFAESARWNAILECENVADLNELTEKRALREFIRVNEALQEKSIARIADRFMESGARVILIAGPSSSGKTTFAHRLTIALRVCGCAPRKLSLDDYYIDRDKTPLDENGAPDFERLDALDVPLFNEQLVRLLRGEEVETPTFDFVNGRRSEITHTMALEPGQPVIIEGIHGLNDELTSAVTRAMKFKIYISALTTLNLDDHNRIRTTDARLLRRIVRDYHFRGTSPEKTLAMWPSVRRGEENYIFPYQEEADVMFNSSLVYEMTVLKKYVYPMLMTLTEDCPQYTVAGRLLKFLNYVRAADAEDEIPLNSILREFIGGSCFYRDED